MTPRVSRSQPIEEIVYKYNRSEIWKFWLTIVYSTYAF